MSKTGDHEAHYARLAHAWRRASMACSIPRRRSAQTTVTAGYAERTAQPMSAETWEAIDECLSRHPAA